MGKMRENNNFSVIPQSPSPPRPYSPTPYFAQETVVRDAKGLGIVSEGA